MRSRAVRYVLAMVILALVVHLTASFVMERRLAAAIAEIDARGEPTELANLIPKDVPDADNAAVIYAEIGELMAADEYRADVDWLHKLGRIENVSPGELEDARLIIDKYPELIALTREAVSRPQCRFEIDRDDHGSAFPDYAKLRRLTQFLVMKARIDLHTGRMDDALDSVALAFGVGESLKDEPLMVGYLVRLAITTMASAALRHTLYYGEIDESQAKRLYDRLGEIDLRSGHRNALYGERALKLERLVEEPDMARQARREMRLFDKEDRRITDFIYDWRPFVRADYVMYLDYMEKLISSAALPYKDKHVEERLPRYAIMATFMSPVYDRMTHRTSLQIAMIDAGRISLALRVYKQRHGEYPDSLDELRAALGWEIPADPFTGEDFKYRREGEGFVLYSVGRNLTDDGGKPWEGDGIPPRDYTYHTVTGEVAEDIIWNAEH